MAKKRAKEFKEYHELVAILKSRGMEIADETTAMSILSQVGYYRLSGFWYPARKFKRDFKGNVVFEPLTGNPKRDDNFEIGTSFEDVFSLYLFDKKLRLLFIDAIEQIEIHLRAAIAHEMGRYSPLAYEDSQYINPKKCLPFTDKKGRSRNLWEEWKEDSQSKLKRSKEDCINWHRISNKEIPFWVAIEAWDFGTLSRYFSMLKGKHRNLIAARLNISNPANLEVWLREINTLRNRCAHHTRIWNQGISSPLPFNGEIALSSLGLDGNALKNAYGLTAVIWFLLRNINGESEWIYDWLNLVKEKPDLPGCSFKAMGLPHSSQIPMDLTTL